MDISEDEPEGYVEPDVVWLVEYIDPREPEEGLNQCGGFTTEAEARKLIDHLNADGGYWADLRLNMVPIHHRLEDWLWDR